MNSVNVCQSYGQEYDDLFFDSHGMFSCSMLYKTLL